MLSNVRIKQISLVALLVFSSTGATAQVTRAINFEERPGPQSIELDGVRVIVQSRDADDEMISMVAAIQADGFQPMITDDGIMSQAGYGRWVGIGKLSSSDPIPSVLMAAFSGGAHCCATLRAIVPAAGKLKVVDFPPIDGEPEQQFPRDLDNDGIVDFERQDDSFRYQFASGAGSYSPPIFYNIYKGQLIEVSDQPGFKKQWEAFAAQTWKTCANRQDDDRNGGCAAYVAASARLGRYEQGLVEAERLANPKPPMGFPEGCSVASTDAECPAEKKLKFYSFSSALRWFLKSRGFIN